MVSALENICPALLKLVRKMSENLVISHYAVSQGKMGSILLFVEYTQRTVIKGSVPKGKYKVVTNSTSLSSNTIFSSKVCMQDRGGVLQKAHVWVQGGGGGGDRVKVCTQNDF